MASFRGPGAMAGSSGVSPEVDPALYRNLVEMIPLMETFMEQQGSRTSMFGRQASMIYTPAPLPKYLYKSYENPLKSKRVPMSPKLEPSHEDSKEECTWEESENILRRIDRDPAQEDFNQDSRHLLEEIEELKQKLWEKDCLLETLGQLSNQTLCSQGSQTDAVNQTSSSQFKSTEGNGLQEALFECNSKPGKHASHGNGAVQSKDEKHEDMKLLQAPIDQLRQKLVEKDSYIQSAQLELREHQQGLGELNLLLEQAERGIVKRSHKASSMEAELTTLRCQVLTLRYQLDAVEAAGLVDASQSEQQLNTAREGPPHRVDMVSSISSEARQKTTFLVSTPAPNGEEQVSSGSEGSKEEKEELELARRKYLAAIMAARQMPLKESLAMVAECRNQLNTFLKDIPTLHCLGAE